MVACVNIITRGRAFSRLLSLLRQDLLRAFFCERVRNRCMSHCMKSNNFVYGNLVVGVLSSGLVLNSNYMIVWFDDLIVRTQGKS